MFTPSFTPSLSTVLKNVGVNREFHSQGITSPPEKKFTPGVKVCSRGEVKNGPLGSKKGVKDRPLFAPPFS
jgi:hypothetical protein